MTNLWSDNHPSQFWLCQTDLPKECWWQAVQRALPIIGLPHHHRDIDELLALVLGEEQFGDNHWRLSLARRLYYTVKPFVPRKITRTLRRTQSTSVRNKFKLNWPIEDRYARFQWEVINQLLFITNQESIRFRCFWPQGQRFAFVLTHDVETAKGLAYVRTVANLEESLGFRSSFNFVPGDYQLDYELLHELCERGFEVGVHGHKHNGKLFNSYTEFVRQVGYINDHLKELNAVGFRSPLTLRNPEWMQLLEVEYDLSFFDTDPFEPMPGGTMSIWPFFVGRFIELPYTLTQDSTLMIILGEKTPKLWLEKVNFIKRYRGMALLNSHPDYLSNPVIWQVYIDFLQAMRHRECYWHALPREVAHWWRIRSLDNTNQLIVEIDHADIVTILGK